MSKVAIVTGGSGGIGRCTALELKKAGCDVYEFSRHGETKDGITHIDCDMTADAQVRGSVAQVLAATGRIDILVCNAGFGISGAGEFTDPKDSHAQLELNLFGMDSAVRAVLPAMRSQHGGRIVCMSSIAGIVPIPFQLWYSVSKSAVISYVLAMQNEVRPFGISLTAVMPGDIASGFTAARKKSDSGDDVYGGRIERSVEVMEHDERTGMTPQKAGAFIARTALKKRGKPMVALGFAYKCAAVAAKLLPRSVSNRIVGKIYAK